MSLTIGRGPFGPDPAGHFDFRPPEHVRFVEPLGRRVRAVRGGQVVIDSADTQLVHESGRLPIYAFPAKDVHVDAHPHPALDGSVVVEWDAVDAWFEEDERVLVHPRDPYHRIDSFATSRRVEVQVNGTIVADTTRAVALYETSLPVRYYVPRVDVRWEHLVPSDTITECAYKGSARHWSAVIDGETVPDVAWSYEDDVRREGEPVRDLLAFYNERVDLHVDGAPQDRPNTSWSR